MRQFYAIFFIVSLLFVSAAKGQVVSITNPTNTTPNLAGTYPTLANAITALNAITAISGPVTITLNAGNPQTAPAGGYVIQFTSISNTAASPVTITGNNNTITAFTPQVSGTLTDAVFKLIGADYITLDNFVMQENSANTTTIAGTNNMTEWGIALLYKSATDGAQNNTIQNNTISLNRNYQNSFGIYSNTRHTATNVGTVADISNNTTAPNSNNKVYGNSVSNVNMGITFVGSGIAANMDTGNDIGGSSVTTANTITNWGGATAAITNFASNSGTFHGIYVNNQLNENVSYNIINSATISGTTTSVRGVAKNYSVVPTGTFTSTINNNSISISNNNASGNFDGVRSDGISTALSTATININNNTFSNNSVGGASSAITMVGINNISLCGVLNITGNTFFNNSSTATTGGFTAISNTGAVTTTVNINNNNIGNASGNAITYSVATSGLLTGISCTAAATAAVSISNNDFRGFNQAVSGTNPHAYISLTHAASGATTDNINNNTFTNLVANTSGSITFINRSGAMALSAGATENCNNNKIITGFSKTVAGGTVTLFNTGSTCLSGNTMIETGNDFSNITLTGATAMNGWDNNEGVASGPTKTINNNIFKNWTGGSSAISVIQADLGGDNSTITGNDIENISGGSFITVISIGGNNKLHHTVSNNIIASITSGSTLFGIAGGATSISQLDITGNDIHSLVATGVNPVEAIRINAATLVNITKNKVYDLVSQNAACDIFGIDIKTATVGATYNIVNNIIGIASANLTNMPLGLRGISISSVAAPSTFNIYYNTVYLNATSSGTDFGTAALYLIANATATTGAVTLRNNILVNTSAANGAGVTVAYRRNGTNLTNYTATSNNNIFYAGTPSATKLIFYDGSNSYQTLAAFKTAVAAREANSFTEMPTFLSTTGSSANFLHLDPATPTQAESGAVNISGYTDDYDGNIRQGNAGYAGTGTAPDIGADEMEGIYSEVNPPVITYTTITTPTCTYSGMTITGVNITDATGVPLSGADRPRIYYRKNAGSWFSQPGTNTSGTTTNSNWSFTIVETDMGTLTGGDIVSYYIIAQDLNPIVNVGSNPSTGLVATSVNSVTTSPTTPNSYTLSYNLSGTYYVGVGGNFTTLTAAVNAYNNACSLAGATIFELIDNSYGSETFPIAINYRADASNTNTLTIRPSATATPVITGASATQIINLNGAKYISFDGRQAGAGSTRTLIISNTGTGVTIQFINDAQNDIVKYCVVKGQRVSSFSATIVFSTANASGTGNDNNTIDHNDISESAGGFSTNGIYSSGTGLKGNDNIVISNNSISNYFNAASDSHGIYVNTPNAASNWTITGNRLFQTATRVYTSAQNHFGIYVTTGSGYTISNNIIGFANEAGTGTTNMIGNSVTLAGFPSSYAVSGTAVAIRYVAIAVALDLFGTTSTIDGNMISGIAMYTSSTASTLFGMFGGIYVETGTVNIGANTGNIIGSTTGTNSVYVATSGTGGTVVGIRAASFVSSSIQNNTIGSITASGTGTSVSGNFTGISTGGTCNYTISNNTIGNTTADNIKVGVMQSGGSLSNAGTLNAMNAGVTATVKGITTTSTGNTVSIAYNTLQGWTMSCAGALNTGIESSGAMSGSNPSVSVNNNFLGTSSVNWLNSTVDNTQFLYGITISNTAVTTVNIKDNDIRGSIFGIQNGVGGSLIKLTGATSANNIATISGNTFTNLNVRFTSGDLYFIVPNYTLSSTGQLFVDNNKIVGSFNSTGVGIYHLLHCLMSASGGGTVEITNNDFSNINANTGFSSNFTGLYTYFGVNPILLTIHNNTFNNWSFGAGGLTGMDINDMTGTLNCYNNTISNMATRGDMEGISIATAGSSGFFSVFNNTITGLASSFSGGYIYGISGYFPTISNTTQTTIDNNVINGLSSTNIIGIVTGVYLSTGHSSGTLSVTRNKIYDLSESTSGGHVYGIYNETSLKGNITYSNNYIGDLRAPSSNVADPSIAGMRLYMVSGQANVYYNTIHLTASGSAAGFSTAAVYADPATQINLRNNIFSNVSGHGASGKTVAYWRGDTNLGTYDAASNNNLFYAGTASAQNLVFYDGTNSDQTLAAYQTRVSPRDNSSVSALTNFISTTGSNTNFLHINASANCTINAKGSNAGILLSSDYDSDSRSTTSPFVTDIGADEFSKKNTWTGANGTSWNDTGNWSEGIVPNADDNNVVISNPPVNQPVIAPGDVYQVASVIIESGASLTNRGTLKIAGSVYTANVAGINNIQAGIVEGSVEMNGNCSAKQTLAGNVFVNNSVKNFTVSNDVAISAVTGEHLNISRELSFGGVTGKTLNTGDNIVLLSTVDATANVADVTGNSISGKATVERYINTGLAGAGRHPKAWQFLATPTQGQTIFQSWQESGSAAPGYGTIITGTGSGFDLTTAQPSMKYYDPSIGANGNWVGITTTGAQLNDQRGYMVFVRGDRTVTTYNAAPNPTNMRCKGNLYQPNNPPPVTSVLAGKPASVGNPYASTIDLDYMKNNNLFVNLNNDVVVWDPLLYGSYSYGGYQTLSAANNYEPTAGGTTYYPAGVASPYIQSGQAFFVQSAGSAGTVTFAEACKENSNRLVNRASRPSIRQYFRISLFTNTGLIADGNAVVFDNNYRNCVDADDAIKLTNSGENFGIKRDNKILSVEARQKPTRNDTIFYSISNLHRQSYQLRVAPKNMQGSGLKAFLIDKYLHSVTALSLSDSSFIDIDINTDSLSAAADRFYVVFKKGPVVPLSNLPHGGMEQRSGIIEIGKNGQTKETSTISIYPNPAENKTLQLHFIQQETGSYHLQLINNLGQIVYSGNIIIKNSSCVQSIQINPMIAAGDYLLKIYGVDGRESALRVMIK